MSIWRTNKSNPGRFPFRLFGFALGLSALLLLILAIVARSQTPAPEFINGQYVYKKTTYEGLQPRTYSSLQEEGQSAALYNSYQRARFTKQNYQWWGNFFASIAVLGVVVIVIFAIFKGRVPWWVLIVTFVTAAAGAFGLAMSQ